MSVTGDSNHVVIRMDSSRFASWTEVVVQAHGAFVAEAANGLVTTSADDSGMLFAIGFYRENSQQVVVQFQMEALESRLEIKTEYIDQMH